jgi:hypothetical protein
MYEDISGSHSSRLFYLTMVGSQIILVGDVAGMVHFGVMCSSASSEVLVVHALTLLAFNR